MLQLASFLPLLPFQLVVLIVIIAALNVRLFVVLFIVVFVEDLVGVVGVAVVFTDVVISGVLTLF